MLVAMYSNNDGAGRVNKSITHVAFPINVPENTETSKAVFLCFRPCQLSADLLAHAWTLLSSRFFARFSGGDNIAEP